MNAVSADQSIAADGDDLAAVASLQDGALNADRMERQRCCQAADPASRHQEMHRPGPRFRTRRY